MAEAFAEGRGRAQADTLRSMRKETVAKLRDLSLLLRPPQLARQRQGLHLARERLQHGHVQRLFLRHARRR